MSIEGVDYAGSRPSPAGLYAAGKRFVVRYGGPGGSWKHLGQAEADALSAAGLMLVANAEGSATGLQGAAAGQSWARSADEHFRGLGMPASKPIYLSADWDVSSAQWPAVRDALRGAAQVIGASRVGVYGSYDVMQWAKRDGVARWFWQTYAWSSGRWAAHSHLEQYRNGVSVAGGPVDLCRALVADYGQWTLVEDDMTPEQAQQLANVYYTLTQIPDPAGGSARIAHHVAMARLDAAVDVIAAKVGVTAADMAVVRSQVAALTDVDEAAVAAAVLATLTPQAIAAAIPAELADQVADELAGRLAS